METGKRHIEIDELFRSKLDNAYVEPSPAFSNNVMKKAARKEFLRFNPTRFNIYYAGLIAAGIVAAGILLLSGHDSPRQQNEYLPETGNTSVIVAPARTGVTKNTATISPGKQDENAEPAPTMINDENVLLKDNNGESLQHGTSKEPIVNTGISGSHQKTGFFEAPPVTRSLKEMHPETGIVPIIPSAMSGCAPLKVTFSNNMASYQNFRWNFGDGGSSELKEPEYIFSSPGEYTVALNASAQGRVPVTHSIQVKVFPAPKADFEISPAKVVIPDEEVRFYNYSRDAVAYAWDFGDGSSSAIFEPVHRYAKYGSYNVSLVVTSEHGCKDSLVLSDAFSGSAYFIEMPNAFIPNPHGPSGGFYSPKSDESAEIFHPSGSGVSAYSMQIFSKRGVLMFESNDINVGWDGYYKGVLSNPGVYVWKIYGRFTNGQAFSKMGDVTLLKN